MVSHIFIIFFIFIINKVTEGLSRGVIHLFFLPSLTTYFILPSSLYL